MTESPIPSVRDAYMAELELVAKLRDYARGQLALTNEGARLLLLDAAEALERNVKARFFCTSPTSR